MSHILVIAEHADGTLNPSTAHTVSAAAAVKPSNLDILVLADEVDRLAAEAAKIHGVQRVLTISRAEHVKPLAAILAPQIAALANHYSHIFLPSTTFGKDLAPRIAALLGVSQVSDVMAIEDTHVFKRPIYAGNAIITVKADPSQPVIATIRIASWPMAAHGNDAPFEPITVDVTLPTHTRYLGLQVTPSDRPALQSARKVVAGGRGIGSKENFDLIFKFADRIKAAVGASRAAVDAGYVPSDLQVGQTGKIIAPDLYIAVGLSGAIQHLTGIRDAGTIVAINKDGDAPIFEVADFGLVGDLFKLLPELDAALNENAT